MSNLYIQQLPSSFASIGEKHNALVDVVKSMSGAGGISVKVSEANVIIDGSGISVTGGGGTEGDPIQVVGSTGLLNTVPKHSTWATPTTYPTQLVAFNYPIQTSIDGFTGFQFTNYVVTAIVGASGYIYNDSSITAVLGTNGLRIEDNGTNLIRVDELGIDWTDGTNTFAVNTIGFLITTSTGSVSIPFSAVSGAIQLREIDVCVSGEAKKMQILASEYY